MENCNSFGEEEGRFDDTSIITSLPIVSLSDSSISNKLIDEGIDDDRSDGLRKLDQKNKEELEFG